MSSYSAISMASSRQFFAKQEQRRMDLTAHQAVSNRAQQEQKMDTEKVAEELEKVTVTLSAEQSVQVTLLSRLFGKQFALPDLNGLTDPNKASANTEVINDDEQSAETANTERLILTQSYYYEYEQTAFSASGTLTLSDGSTAEFNFKLGYSREFETYSETLGFERQLKDPLVINLSDQPMSLSDQTIQFDLDMDGELDNISTLSQGAGFIGLDKNNNGIIDDGSELFGASSGNGFYELSKFDDNQDGVINKNDKIYSELVVWQPGNANELTRLSDTKVDTLSLQTVDTEYTFKDSENRTLGQMRKSSIYANNDGSVGALHQIDLSI